MLYNYIIFTIKNTSKIKKLISELKKTNKNVDYNIFKSCDNVNLNCILGTTKNGVYKSFLEDYKKE